jgi:hypothetical protein
MTIVNPFIHPTAKKRFRNLTSNWKNELKELIDDDNLPIEYGGNAPNPF